MVAYLQSCMQWTFESHTHTDLPLCAPALPSSPGQWCLTSPPLPQQHKHTFINTGNLSDWGNYVTIHIQIQENVPLYIHYINQKHLTKYSHTIHLRQQATEMPATLYMNKINTHISCNIVHSRSNAKKAGSYDLTQVSTIKQWNLNATLLKQFG